jgi:hypothetical protein
VGYRWYSLRTGDTSGLAEGASFESDVPPLGEQALDVVFRSPEQAGEYLLIWFVTRRDGSFRALGQSYSPAVMCTVSPPGIPPPPFSRRAMSYLEEIRKERRAIHVELVPSRVSLWLAAIRMFAEHPVLGSGPDNFRLLKWRFMRTHEGDEKILANNTYLEFLAGSGLPGLAAFIWLGWEIARLIASGRRGPGDFQVLFYSTAYFTSFFVHGLVDYFLKFTPTFLLFWISVGILAGTLSGEETG